MRKINNVRWRTEPKTCRKDLDKIDKYVQEMVTKIRKSSDILVNQIPVHLQRWVNPKPIDIRISQRWVTHLTKWDLIWIMMGILTTKEE